MGDRLALEPASAAAPAFADAVARASRMTVLRRAGWEELMARVSHELRTPLNAVIGFSDVMHTELFGPVGHPRYREYARHIRDCGRDLLKSAEDTLALTYLLDNREGRASSLDLASVARDAWDFLSGQARPGAIRFALEAPDGLELVGERRPLRQILINLFSEAVERAAPGGTVTLSASTDGDLVQLEVFVHGAARPGRATGEASLAVCLARALLELQGATLVELTDAACAWRAVTVLSRAVQRDFFDPPPPARPAGQPAQLC
jgi:signal transduction histidine kinase